MSNATGIIFANSGYDSLQGLAKERPIAAVPFGGRYRILDFALSSMVNSGLRTIGLVIPRYYRPLLDHLGAGKDWFLDRKGGGLFILPGAIHGLAGNDHAFCIKDLEYNIEFLQKDFEENLIISRGDQIINFNFEDALQFHSDRNADVTLIYKKNVKLKDPHYKRLLEMDKDQKVYNVKYQKSLRVTELHHPYFMNMLIIRRKLIQSIIEKYGTVGCMDLMDVLTLNSQTLRIYGRSTDSLIEPISTIKDYFQRSMDLLNLDIRKKLWLGENRIHTKIVDNPPTRYTAQAKVSNSLIASGCMIAGEVQNSIIFRGVTIQKGCQIRNSIILPNCYIGENVQTEYAVLDKFVKVNEENVLKGSLDNPLGIIKSTVI